jgi:hypothetical protein
MTSKLIESFGARGSHAGKLTEKDLPQRTAVWRFLKESYGERGSKHILEALTTSDFDYILTNDMNAQLLTSETLLQPSYENWARTITVPDFKSNPLPYLNNIAGYMDIVPEATELKYANLTDGQYTIQADAFEKGMKLTRQDIVNDALNAFRSVPEKLGQLAMDTVEHYAVGKIADASGPDATLFTEGHANLMSSELSIAALDEAVNLMAAQTDANGKMLNLQPKGILVPPQLRAKAQRLVAAFEVETIDDTNGFRTRGSNQYSALEVSVSPEITAISTSNTYVAKQWYMYTDPMRYRPAVAVAKLRDNPNPRIMSLAPDSVLVGGGTDPYSFKGNGLEYKVAWDLGFAQIDYRSMVASKPTS